MGRTFTREKNFDERGKGKKRLIADRQRKENKNKIIDVVYEDDEDIEIEDEYEFEQIQHYKPK